MQLEGSLEQNLRQAIRSSERLRYVRVYGDTLEFWRSLAKTAKIEAARRCTQEAAHINHLVRALEDNLGVHESQRRIS
jgi:plasmid maintenance system antidote protein VapI